MTDPFAVASEHIAWCVREGWSLADIQTSLGRRDPFRNWHDALIAVAQEQGIMILQRPELRHAQVSIGRVVPPFRRREPAQRVCLCDNLCRHDQLTADRYCRFERRVA